MIKHKYKIKVFYKDVDQMGVVYYSRYFEYFEQARTEMLSSIGLNVTDIETEGIQLPVISSHCDYKKGAKFEDNLIIISSINDLPKATLKINYEVYNKNINTLIALGYTVHAFLKKNGKLTKVPPKILLKLKKEKIAL